MNKLVETKIKEYFKNSEKDEMKLAISIIAPKRGEVYCKCGYHGRYETYYKSNKFVCPNCGNNSFHIVNGLKKGSINLALLKFYSDIDVYATCDKDYTLDNDCLLLTDMSDLESIKLTQYSLNLTLKEEGVYGKLKTKNLVYNSYANTVSYITDNGKLKDSNISLSPAWLTIILNKVLDNLEYPTKFRFGFIHKVSPSLMRFITSPSFYVIDYLNLVDKVVFSNSLLADLNFEGTNIKSVLGLPNGICKYLLGTSYISTSYTDDSFSFILKSIKELLKKGVSVNNVITALKHLDLLYVKVVLSNAKDTHARYEFAKCIRAYFNLLLINYNSKLLITYLADIYKKQGITIIDAIQILRDYATMCNDMKLKYVKYPKSLKLVHDIAMTKYVLVKDDLLSEKVRCIAEENKHLEFKNKYFEIRLPKSCDDVILLGNVLSNCVASYVPRIVNKETLILGMYDITEDKYVTLFEVMDNRVVQFYAKANTTPRLRYKNYLGVWRKAKGVELG